MNPAVNPFAPGAGTQPPELTGREVTIDAARTALVRLRAGRHARSQMLLGLRGVGKTVLLNALAAMAEDAGFHTIHLEAPEGRSLPEMLVPPLRSALFRLSRVDAARDVARKGLGILRAFAGAFRISAGDIEFSVEPELGTADSGQIQADLPELMVAVAKAAREADQPIALLIDEVQYLEQHDLAALIVALHRIAQKNLPLILFGAGLPQLAALAGEAKSYAERLFNYVHIGALAAPDAERAIRTPIEREGATITDEALRQIVLKTQGYPYFLQEWGSEAWNAASGTCVEVTDVEKATNRAIEQLDRSFFRVRLDRLTPREQTYMRAMAQLGAGPHRSGDIAHAMGVRVESVAPLRASLIKKGMIYSPQHGDTAFTVPMFDAFLLRAMPATPARRSR